MRVFVLKTKYGCAVFSEANMGVEKLFPETGTCSLEDALNYMENLKRTAANESNGVKCDGEKTIPDL